MSESGDEHEEARRRREEAREDRARRLHREDQEQHDRYREHMFWRLFALLALGLLAFLILAGVIFDRGVLARSEARERDAAQAKELRAARERDAAQTEELRVTASTDRARLVGESLQAASVLASTLVPAAREAGAAGHDLLRQGGDLTGQFLKEVGFPLGKDAARTVGQAIWHHYVKSPKNPSALVVPVVIPGTSGRVSSTINLTIVIREGRRPQVITKVVRIPDDPG